MDGNYGGTLDIRLAAADTIIFLDLPPPLCVWRAARRAWQYRRRTRPDMGPGCPERLDPAFVRWIWTYRRNKRPGILEKMRQYAEGRRIAHLQTPAEVRRFLDGLPRLDSAAPLGL
jgi:adenylate kinase family enzyme